MKDKEMNKTFFNILVACLGLLVLSGGAIISAFAQRSEISTALDAKVQNFLNESRGRWHDLNVPYEDGKVLYNLIIKGNYKNALEIGTSTGHSAIWIAWV
jgi:predicted O-methyltransferase YrrM